MSITDHEGFNQLCALSGITDDYYDIRGHHHVASFEAKQALLAAMRTPIENDADIHLALEKIRLHDWQTAAPPVQVYRINDSHRRIHLTLASEQISQPVHWQLSEQNGQSKNGVWHFETQQANESLTLNDRQLWRFDVELPPVSEIGYHQLILELCDQSSAQTLLIVAPETCYLPSDFENSKKLWGINCQLYSLRSKRNWGIGDFTDLGAVIDILAPLGIDAIGLNPLHALFPHLPENASPYSPSSRNFINPIYLNIEAIEQFERSADAQKLVKEDSFQKHLQSLRDKDLVDYRGVWQVKLKLLKLLYHRFRSDLTQSESESVKDFRQFQANGGEELFKFCLFEALQLHFHTQDSAIETWQQWPEAYRLPDSNSVRDWADNNLEQIEFHQYLQWQVKLQISGVQQACQKRDMRVGIYNDLAVGDERFSSACWGEQSQYALGVGIGAPPDDFNLSGQNWGLPAQLPQALHDDAYRLFIQTLRANMRHAGALRIDHVMGLMRLYWVPKNYSPDQGTYVRYPFDDLLGILALESQLSHCLIVGEDLGTVPDEVRHQLWVNRVLSYRVLFFEKDWHHGSFKPPVDYPPFALCTSGSHDLPPLKAFWQESDIEIRESLNLYPSDDIRQQQRESRAQDRDQIKAALYNQQLIDQATLNQNDTQFDAETFEAIQRFLARSESRLMMVQLEDMLSQSNQINLPGTIDEYPNWRHKISIDIEDWLKQSELQRYAKAINDERGVA